MVQLVGKVWDPEKIESEDAEPCRKLLQRRGQKRAEWHQEHQEQERAREPPVKLTPENRQKQNLHPRDRRELSPFHDAQPLGDQPDDANGNRQQCPTRLGSRGASTEHASTLPNEIQRHRQDKVAVAVGCRSVPDVDSRPDLAKENERESEQAGRDGNDDRPIERRPLPYVFGTIRDALSDKPIQHLSYAAHDHRPQCIRNGNRQPLPSRDEQPVLRIQRVVIRHTGSRTKQESMK